MTISTQLSRVDVLGNGSATTFSFSPVTIFEASDLVVTMRDASGNQTALSQGVSNFNYSVNVGVYPGTGSITYPAAGSTGGTVLPTGSSLTIKRILPILQSTDLENQGAYLAAVVENEFDLLCAVDQQLQEQVNRTLQVAATDPQIPLTLPTAIARANQLLGFDSGGNPIVAQPSSAIVSSVMQAVVDSASVAAALALLGGIGKTQASTGQFYQSAGANIDRFNDRVFVGAATVNTANVNSAEDYVSVAIAAGGVVTGSSQFAAMSTVGAIGGLFGTRTSDSASLTPQNGLALMAVAVNNNTAHPGIAEAAYFEAQQKAGTGITTTVEIDTVNQTGSLTPVTPFSSFASVSAVPYNIGLQIGAGGARAGVSPSSAAIVLIGNGTTFDRGIVFINGSFSGSMEALSMANGMSLQWYGTVSGLPSGFVKCLSTNANYGIAMLDAATYIGNSTTNNSPGSLQVVHVPSVANYVSITGAVAGGTPLVQALGGGTNIDLILGPKGTGRLRLGGPIATSGTAGGSSALPATPQGYITVVIDNTGAVGKIPYYNN